MEEAACPGAVAAAAMPSVRLVHHGGSRITSCRPVFSTDSRYLFCASGDHVKIYSTATEECIHVLQGHKDLVTGIQLNPQNHLQLYSASLDGTIKLWDFTDGILMKTFSVNVKLLALYTPAGDENTVFAIVPRDKGLFQLVSIKLPKSTAQEVDAQDFTVILEDVCQSQKSTAFGREGKYVASVKTLELQVFFFKKKKSFRFPLSFKQTKGSNNAFTCVTCHPKEDCIATGHQDGKIRLWWKFTHKKEYTYSSQHWHYEAVNDLVFSTEGTNLLSGGIESVLVQWRFGSEANKDFLPRLGEAIEHIATSPDGFFHSTSHSDNKIVIIKSNLERSAIIQGLVKGQDVSTGMMIDPRSKALVLNGKPGHLQFYSLQTDKQLYNLDIVQQEYINQSGLNQIKIVKAAFDFHGTWLATVEERMVDESEIELRMKLWIYNEENQSFVLNTTICMPHENHIVALCFGNFNDSRSPPTLVTAGLDCQFKVWILGDDSDIYRESICWTCDFVGTYHNLQATNCSFSEDSSLLAVSFEQIVTLWDADTWDLKCTFCQPPGKIRHLAFGRFSCSKYLLATTDNGFLCCWNLLCCSLEWSAQLNVKALQVDPLSENVAVFSEFHRCTDLFVFKPNEPRPVYMQKNVCDVQVRWALFVPRELAEDCNSDSQQWLARSQLYFLTDSQDLMTFSTKPVEERLTLSSKQLATDENAPMTPFHVLLGKHRQQREKSGLEGERTALPEGSATINEMLHTPAHVLPNASFLCLMFMNSLLIPKMGESTNEKQEEVEIESEKDEDESDIEMNLIEDEQEVKKVYSSEELLPKLTKSEEKELKKLQRTNYSWLFAV
ncbi:WD repeat-containing protein 75 [Amblyraja radiata]|uniref:WD repeat-containing protein 75 n=1 Tax=Amblyraja radiata TaxID=386614 RepID=UPI00140349B6|nr:WD repeat-containing protein 75 [Amblyraja radiata]